MFVVLRFVFSLPPTIPVTAVHHTPPSNPIPSAAQRNSELSRVLQQHARQRTLLLAEWSERQRQLELRGSMDGDGASISLPAVEAAEPACVRMARQRASLPMAAVREQVLAALEGSDAVVVCAETGSGKTTQVRGERNWERD